MTQEPKHLAIALQSVTPKTSLAVALGASALLALSGAPGCSASDGGKDGSGGSGAGQGSLGSTDGTGGGSSFTPAGGGAVGDVVIPNCTMDCTDFPAEPYFDPASSPGVLQGDLALFGDDPNAFTDGLCALEPQLGSDGKPGALLPANWLRPRFRWTPAPGDALFEIRLSAAEQKNDYVIYTRASSFTMPQDVWDKVARNTHQPITVTIRGAGGSVITGQRGTFQIAPVNARGSMVFWGTTTKQITKTASFLLGFEVGQDTVQTALVLSDVLPQTPTDRPMTEYDGHTIRDVTADTNKPGHLPGDMQCIGCHVSTPDGDAVLFVDDWPWAKAVANIDPEAGAIGAEPTWLTDAGRALLRMPFQGTPTMSPGKWSDGNRLMVTSLADRGTSIYEDAGVTWSGADLVWINMASTAAIDPKRGVDPYNEAQARSTAIQAAKGSAWGSLLMNGETFESAVNPDWSHDGARIAYTATNKADNGHPSKSDGNVPADIHILPFADGAGGDVTPLVGASDPAHKEYYPAFSEDDSLIAFNRAGAGAPYFNSSSEIFVVASEGGEARRLNANDPPLCAGEVSPGITNSWAKWSPSVVSHQGKRYYFLVFSSARNHEGQFLMSDPWAPSAPAQKSAQLYMAALVVDEATGEITDYPSVYLWNQGRLAKDNALTEQVSSNLTPAWDSFKLPPPPTVK